MSTTRVFAAGLCLATLVACSIPVDVSKEVGLLAKATDDLAKDTRKGLKSQIDAFEEAAPDRAAAANEDWTLSLACDSGAAVFDYSSLDACVVEKTADETVAAPPPSQVQAVLRKMDVLAEYSALLADLASSNTEAQIKLSYARLAASLKEFGKKGPSERATSFAASLGDEQKKFNALVDFGVQKLRNRLMRKAVREAHPLVVQITGELKAHLRALRIDPGYAAAYSEMLAARDRADAASGSGDQAAMAVAYRDLERKHAAFIKTARGSVFTKLDLLAAAHEGLGARLGRSPDSDALVAYLKALQDLTQTLEN